MLYGYVNNFKFLLFLELLDNFDKLLIDKKFKIYASKSVLFKLTH
jgi:hypothetical protein